MRRTINGKWGWLALGIFIVLWDVLEEDQLSHAFRRCPKPLTCMVTLLVIGHLYEVIPKKYDPIHLLLRKPRKRHVVSHIQSL
jgi:hypothetical protein